MTKVASFFLMQPTRIDLRDADMRIHAETSLAGCSLLMHVARIASVVEDFPRSVTIAGGEAHVRLDRGAHGVWGLAGSDRGLLEVIEGRVPTSFASAVSLSLDAMGCINTHETRARAASLTAWPGPDRIAESLFALKGTLHPHVRAAAVGYAEDIVSGIVPDWNLLRVTLRTWVQSLAAEVGHDMLVDALHRTVPSPVGIAAAGGRNETIDTLARLDVELDRPMPEGHVLAGHTPGSLALRAGKFETASALLRHDASPDTVAGDGDNLLHSAAKGIVSHALHEDDAIEMAATLLMAKVDLSAQNRDGETPADLLEAAEPEVRAALARYLDPTPSP